MVFRRRGVRKGGERGTSLRGGVKGGITTKRRGAYRLKRQEERVVTG